jgi:hypothetical protein
MQTLATIPQSPVPTLTLRPDIEGCFFWSKDHNSDEIMCSVDSAISDD